ncbi:MAG TPA: OB-fold nucleic acid binding domain-containing protein, partial [Candidatus Acidoferrales bacterium]|nr:OB-fold nucleic acid binding domain-containing protein [Candidatus Acidoferrales bacterium]
MELDFLGELKRTHRCGELRASDAGKTVTVMGWVNKRRDFGDLVFIDLRDRSGLVQIVFDRSTVDSVHDKVNDLRSEYVIAVTGPVRLRDKDAINPKLDTGE